MTLEDLINDNKHSLAHVHTSNVKHTTHITDDYKGSIIMPKNTPYYLVMANEGKHLYAIAFSSESTLELCKQATEQYGNAEVFGFNQ